MKKMSIKTVVAVGIGAALFFVLARFVAIPSGIANTSICLQYAVLALFAILYGPVAGGLIGFIGHTLGDLSWGGSPWWSWVLASAMVGVIIGLVSKKIDLSSGRFGKKELITFVLTTLVAMGETCPAELVAGWAPGRRMFNAYGPTEATVWATCSAALSAGQRFRLCSTQ